MRVHLARLRIVVMALLIGVSVAAEPAGAAPAWSVTPTPAPRLVSTAVLSGVSCPSPRACLAVGYQVDAAGAPVPLAERWNGRRWAIGSPPAPPATGSFLFGVSCATARSCMAVGSSTRRGETVALAERWNGIRWALQPALQPGGRIRGAHPTAYLAAVACPSTAACTAVGYAGNRAGTLGAPLIARWTRNAGWLSQPAAPPPAAKAAFLSGVSCASPSDCAAVGFLATRAGTSETLAEHWTQDSWHLERIPTPVGATAVQLTGVSCPSPSFCSAVGYFDTAGIDIALAERWNGIRWVIGRARYPRGARSARLAEVSCPSLEVCMAVGVLNAADGLNAPLVEGWTPRGWAVQPTPPIGTAAAPADAELSGVSCRALGRCVAVGDIAPLSGSQNVLAERAG